MAGINEYSNKNTRILLSRNSPVALVVGAGGFLGSHLVDKLLSKSIQVIGVDNLSSGKRENLAHASEDKDFHLVIEDAENLDLEIERLDYIFIASQEEVNLKKILDLFKDFKCRLLLISSVELYGEDISSDLKWLKKAEVAVAEKAVSGADKKYNLNARILRLGPVFGPRMSFSKNDAMAKLIAQSINGDLQKDVNLEFSSRSLYIDDAVELAIKCNFAGATAQKIFDGVNNSPIKIEEIKQVLLDPVWHETKNFEASELPPWPTPNLEKTIKFLNWHPRMKLVKNLKETLNYFRDNGVEIPKIEQEIEKEDGKLLLNEEKKGELEALKLGRVEEDKVEKKKRKTNFHFSRILSLFITAFVVYALIWPIFELSWGVLAFRFQLAEAVRNLEKGEFDKSLSNVSQANGGVEMAKSIFLSLQPIRETGILKSQFETGDNLSYLATLSSDAASSTILGIQALYQSLKSVTGESETSPKEFFDLSNSYLSLADSDLSKAEALINNPSFKQNLPSMFKGRVDNLSEKLSLYSNLVKKARAISSLLPEVVALNGSKDYLILFQNNNELRPTGGFIGSYGQITFEGGKLKKLKVNDIYSIDGNLSIHVEPPKEIKEDLGQKDFYLRDSNWEPDFPTSARQAEWFYNKETGERVHGVIALDISAAADLLSVMGPLDLPDYSEKVTSDNLFEKSITHAEANFFPGTQAKKGFLTALTQGIFNQLFFLSNQNWPGVVASLGRSMEQKHLSIYLDDPKLFSYLVSQGWTNALPRPLAEKNSPDIDLLLPVEANLGANKANYYIDRNYNLETVIGKDGDISHRLRIAYTNKSPSTTFPGGTYKNRMRIYMPFGTKLTRILWGETDITKSVTAFIDYGRSGYSFLIELSPKEKKTLVLDYSPPFKLNFVDGRATYKLDVIKQAGTLKDPFIWNLTFPLNMRLGSNQEGKIGPQEQTIQTDLSKDRSFEVTFTK